MKDISLTYIETPLGSMIAYATDFGVCMLDFHDSDKLNIKLKSMNKNMLCNIVNAETPILKNLKSELEEYFTGKRQQFTVPLHLVGSDFQKAVWNELLKIPFGKTTSYKQIAENIGNIKAVRAVANANACNKISLIVPCHRVIGSDGSLTGYAGGLDRKSRLLKLEK